jgi:hypothetical protein
MYSVGNSDLICTEYSIPINAKVLGYLQFYIKDTVINKNDVISIKTYVVNLENGLVTKITALNKISQYLGNGLFQTVIQGLNGLPTLRKFKFKTEIVYGGAPNVTKNYYSPVYSWEVCSDISPIIPCVIDGQLYTINDNYIGDIEGNIVYQSWHTATEKKYTPCVFIRNVSFNRKSNTVEYKKLNNKPLRTTLKRNYSLYCEPVSQEYINEIDDVFTFGKVNILSKTYVLDTYIIDTLDEKDCCPMYKITATAYEESKIRLLCSNNCVILEPIDCDDLVSNDFVYLIDVVVPEYQNCEPSNASIVIESLAGNQINKGFPEGNSDCDSANINIKSLADLVLAKEFATNTIANVPIISIGNKTMSYGF